ncbi:class I SAM-dependent methyltransferase [Pseudomonas luteola]|uniref:class I SAM-dependent methyltransferase n=1 Tax=Pseudomonas luteola TaxID=47886 RepID=UPI001EF4F12E|nr:class I SAM-dependent methyltransferase [Pseudomonas luteola]MCG7373465.1 class I SAM-dependent methyltransferase [Pseudomonas luteola]
MNSTYDYYQQHAAQFFAETAEVDMHELHMQFLARIPAGGYILDAGCSSGRDAKAFVQMGYQVSAFDASPVLADLASNYLGQPVQVLRFS